jgi:hypothetical protein
VSSDYADPECRFWFKPAGDFTREILVGRGRREYRQFLDTSSVTDRKLNDKDVVYAVLIFGKFLLRRSELVSVPLTSGLLCWHHAFTVFFPPTRTFEKSKEVSVLRLRTLFSTGLAFRMRRLSSHPHVLRSRQFGLALCLALAGVYGVMAYAVGQRSKEIGVRMALGASRGSVLRLILGQGMTLTAIGLALGLASAIASARLLATMLFQVQPGDPMVYLTVTVLLGVVALLATYVPARRASSIDPLATLRQE